MGKQPQSKKEGGLFSMLTKKKKMVKIMNESSMVSQVLEAD